MKKKGTTKKEKSDKSHEQSDFSPHIIQKKKKGNAQSAGIANKCFHFFR